MITLQLLIITLELMLMASDSAVTVNGLKAFNGVQKIFNIKEDIPISIMVNGSARFCGVSFEKIFKEFKHQKFEGKYTVENVKNNLIKFIENSFQKH